MPRRIIALCLCVVGGWAAETCWEGAGSDVVCGLRVGHIASSTPPSLEDCEATCDADANCHSLNWCADGCHTKSVDTVDPDAHPGCECFRRLPCVATTPLPTEPTTAEIATTAPETTQSPTEPPPAATNGTCSMSGLDIVIAAEGFALMSTADYAQVLAFVSELVSRAPVDAGLAQVAMYQLSHVANITGFHLKTHSSLGRIQEAVADFSSTHPAVQGVDLIKAFAHALEKGFHADNGDKAEFRDVVILLTDGADADADAVAKLRSLHTQAAEHNVAVFAIGVGGAADAAQLQAAAGGPDNVFMASGPELAALEEGICTKVAQKPPSETCIAHAGHYAEGGTLEQCTYNCDHATFANQTEKCLIANVDMMFVVAGFREGRAGLSPVVVDAMAAFIAQSGFNHSIAQVGVTVRQEDFSASVALAQHSSAQSLRDQMALFDHTAFVDIAAALDTGIDNLRVGENNGNYRDIIVLFADGPQKGAGGIAAIQASAARAANLNITVFAIGIGAGARRAELEAATGNPDHVYLNPPSIVADEANDVCRRAIAPAEEESCVASSYFLVDVTKCRVACESGQIAHQGSTCLEASGDATCAHAGTDACGRTFRSAREMTADGATCAHVTVDGTTLTGHDVAVEGSHPNFCTNFDNDPLGPWCYQADGESYSKGYCYTACVSESST